MIKVPESFEIVVETATNKHYVIRPSDIYVGIGCLLSSFGAAEIEQEAERLVRFFQRRGFWSGFQLEELVLFYHEQGWKPEEALCGLAKPWFDDWNGWVPAAKPYVVQDSDGQYFVTNLFIERCKAAADPTALIAMVEGLVETIVTLQDSGPKKTH